MMPEWLIALIAALIATPTALLCWYAWRMERERAEDDEREQKRRERVIAGLSPLSDEWPRRAR